MEYSLPCDLRIQDLIDFFPRIPFGARILLPNPRVSPGDPCQLVGADDSGDRVDMPYMVPGRVIRSVLAQGRLNANESLTAIWVTVERLPEFVLMASLAKYGYALACCEALRRYYFGASREAAKMLRPLAAFRGESDSEWEDTAFDEARIGFKTPEERFVEESWDVASDRIWRIALTAVYETARRIMYVGGGADRNNEGLVILSTLLVTGAVALPEPKAFQAWRPPSVDRWLAERGPRAWSCIVDTMAPPLNDGTSSV